MIVTYIVVLLKNSNSAHNNSTILLLKNSKGMNKYHLFIFTNFINNKNYTNIQNSSSMKRGRAGPVITDLSTWFPKKWASANTSMGRFGLQMCNIDDNENYKLTIQIGLHIVIFQHQYSSYSSDTKLK